MKKTILVAGATGNLGSMICSELVKRGAVVKALIREESDLEKTAVLTQAGVEVIAVDYHNPESLKNACIGADCVVSALAGLADVIVDTQKILLDAALEAGVKKFIPSDFCTDYNVLVPGENRNFDLRREFKQYIDRTAIQATSIFNGAFADILKYNTPILNLKHKTIAYWGDKADWKLDFTTMDDTAAFTAEVAMEEHSPRYFHIASFQISANMLSEAIKLITGQHFNVQKLSDMDEFAAAIKKQRAENPSGEMELYAKWQQAQYMYSMYSTQHTILDNENYKHIDWTTATQYLRSFVK
ncbi:NmrA family NAD(P)-binding protein [Pedobacter sp. R20-19]|uniref:NmrA family NAD(P)-binding protein n=1 Tax=Pedobacter sp. R20-19 TaxID=1270196 RepID=UPI000493002D|nr:NmrA family NAD(P)-binding protein [Pedobacter sp. R20-19]